MQSHGKKRSLQASENFVSVIEETLQEIKSSPDHFKKIYKNFRQINKKISFQHSLFYRRKNTNSNYHNLFSPQKKSQKKFK